ncbi:MAG: DNA adenine methylase [Dokdonella sp.]
MSLSANGIDGAEPGTPSVRIRQCLNADSSAPVSADTALPRPLLRYHGGKWKLAPWITRHFAPHRVYVEPFCGGGSILLRKDRSHAEIVNDLDAEIVNLFRVLRDPERSNQLIKSVRLTPFAREEFNATYSRPARSPVERARRLVARSFMGFGSASTYAAHRTGFRASSSRSGTTPAYDWMNYPDGLARIVERLRGVIVEQRDAVQVIASHDSPDTLIYCDPPYVMETRCFKRRVSGHVYKHDFNDDDHRRLATCLRAAKGMVMLSGYAHPLYDNELFPDWHRVALPHFADGARPRVEVLWMNDAAKKALPQPSLFES